MEVGVGGGGGGREHLDLVLAEELSARLELSDRDVRPARTDHGDRPGADGLLEALAGAAAVAGLQKGIEADPARLRSHRVGDEVVVGLEVASSVHT